MEVEAAADKEAVMVVDNMAVGTVAGDIMGAESLAADIKAVANTTEETAAVNTMAVVQFRPEHTLGAGRAVVNIKEAGRSVEGSSRAGCDTPRVQQRIPAAQRTARPAWAKELDSVLKQETTA